MFRIRVPQEKTDHEVKSKEPPREMQWFRVDGTVGLDLWAVRLINYAKSRLEEAGGNEWSPLFANQLGGFASARNISDWVKVFAKEMLARFPKIGDIEPIEGISGCSFRPGACSALRTLGYSVDQVSNRSTMNWRSRDMVATYNRPPALDPKWIMPDSCVAGVFRAMLGKPAIVAAEPVAPIPLSDLVLTVVSRDDTHSVSVESLSVVGTSSSGKKSRSSGKQK